MIPQFITRFEAKKAELRSVFEAAHPGDYIDIVRAVISILADDHADWESPDPKRIHAIDDGDYQGTLVFVIASQDYQPDNYWYVRIAYGSCSGCDTLQAISEYSGETPTEGQVDQYMTLATHILQGLKRMGDDNQEGPFA